MLTYLQLDESRGGGTLLLKHDVPNETRSVVDVWERMERGGVVRRLGEIGDVPP